MSKRGKYKTSITNRQREVLEYMREYFLRNDQLPPRSTVSDHFGWASPNAADEHMGRLRAKGYLGLNENGKYKFSRGA